MHLVVGNIQAFNAFFPENIVGKHGKSVIGYVDNAKVSQITEEITRYFSQKIMRCIKNLK